MSFHYIVTNEAMIIFTFHLLFWQTYPAFCWEQSSINYMDHIRMQQNVFVTWYSIPSNLIEISPTVCLIFLLVYFNNQDILRLFTGLIVLFFTSSSPSLVASDKSSYDYHLSIRNKIILGALANNTYEWNRSAEVLAHLSDFFPLVF